MQKKAILYFLAALMLIISAIGAAGLDIVEDSIVLAGNESDTVSSTFTVHNNESADILKVMMSVDTLNGVDDPSLDIEAGNVQFVPSNFPLAAGENQTVTVYIIIPDNQFAQDYTATIDATELSTTPATDSAHLYLEVEPREDFALASTSPSIVQGFTDELIISLINTGNTDIALLVYDISNELTKGAVPLEYDEPDAGFVNVPYDEEVNLTLTFDVPVDQEVGTYTGIIDVDSPTDSASKSLSVSIAARNEDVATTSLQNGKLAYNRNTGEVIVASKQSFEFNMTNTGNVDLDDIAIIPADLTSGSNTIDEGNLLLSHTSVDLPVGSSQLITVSPLGLDTANLTSGTYTGAFTIAYGSDNKTISVQYEVRDAIPSVTFEDLTLPEGPRDSVQNMTFVVTNDGDYGLTNVDIYPSEISSNAEINMSGLGFSTLSVGESKTISLSVYVPESQSAGVKKIAKMNFNSTELTKTATLYSSVYSKLSIKKVKLILGGKKDTLNNDGETHDDDVQPGDTFSMDVTVENRFTDDEDIEIEDISVEVIMKELGEDEDDIDGESDEFNLDADKDKEVSIDFDDDEIGFDIDEGTYEVEITVSGDDENGGTQEDSWTIYVKVDRENKVDIRLDSVELSPSTVSCFRSAYLEIEGENYGKKDDGDSRLVIKSSKLDLDKEYEFDIGDYQEDDCDAVDNPKDDCSAIDHSESIWIPEDVAEGTYTIDVIWYYDNNEKGDSETVSLRVESCGGTSSSSTTDDSGSSDTSSDSGSSTTDDDTTSGSTASDVDVQFASGGSLIPSGNYNYASEPTRLTDTTEPGFTDSLAYLVILGIATLLLIAIAVGMVSSMGRKN